MHAVAEAARNVACAGALPVAATNCLNFGNPEKPEVMWQFREAIDGIAEACRALGTPVTGGNVSFYNETLGQAIYPTPVIGILGILEDASHALGLAFAHAGDFIILLDAQRPGAIPAASDAAREFSSSEYSKSILGIVAGAPPAIDLDAEKRLIDCLVALAEQTGIASAHDVSDGGLAVTLAECCFASEGLSARVDLESEEPAEVALFGERGARAVVSLSPDSLAPLATLAAQYNVRAQEIGTVTRGEFRIQLNGTARIAAPVSSLRDEWASSLERALGIQ
jgi:phosphoribosylformylglycinamidine synthase